MEIINSIYKSYSGLNMNDGNYVKLSDLAKLSSDIKAKCVPLDLSTPKNVYFSKNVIFPRNKIQLIDNATRVIKLSKADIAVVDPNIKTHTLWSEYLVYETAKGEKFISTVELSRIQIPGVKQISKESERFVLLNKSDIIDELENLLTVSSSLVDINNFNQSAVINTSIALDIQSMENLLCSTNHDYITLGLKTLCQFDIKSYRIEILNMIMKNKYEIKNNKFFNSSLGVNFLQTLAITKYDLTNNLDDIYNKVYKFYSDKEKMQIAQHISKTRLELIESRIKDINSRYPNVPFISADVILHQSEPFMATYKSKIINEQKANE